MHVDIALYEKSRSLAIDWYESNGKNINRTIGMVSSMTMVPCIAVAYWLGAHLNWGPDSVAAIQRLKDFYDYSSIDGKPPGAPL